VTMYRRLPCKNCPDGATLTDGAGRKIPYEISVHPSAFRTNGATFNYDCLGCGKKGRSQKITKAAFYALMDMGLPAPAQT